MLLIFTVFYLYKLVGRCNIFFFNLLTSDDNRQQHNDESAWKQADLERDPRWLLFAEWRYSQSLHGPLAISSFQTLRDGGLGLAYQPVDVFVAVEMGVFHYFGSPPTTGAALRAQ